MREDPVRQLLRLVFRLGEAPDLGVSPSPERAAAAILEALSSELLGASLRGLGAAEHVLRLEVERGRVAHHIYERVMDQTHLLRWQHNPRRGGMARLRGAADRAERAPFATGMPRNVVKFEKSPRRGG